MNKFIAGKATVLVLVISVVAIVSALLGKSLNTVMADHNCNGEGKDPNCQTPTPTPTYSPTATPTVTPTATPTATPCGEFCATPTASPTLSPTPTEEPTSTPISCSGDQHPDAAGKNCVSFQFGGPSGGGGGGQVLGASTEAGGQVLGASTMAKTGMFEDNLRLAILVFGALLNLGGIARYVTAASNFKRA